MIRSVNCGKEYLGGRKIEEISRRDAGTQRTAKKTVVNDGF